MKLIIGLGNFDDKYLLTRHNAGFMAVDFLAQEHSQTFKSEAKFKAKVAKFQWVIVSKTKAELIIPNRKTT